MIAGTKGSPVKVILPLSVWYTTGLRHRRSGGGHHAGQSLRPFCRKKSPVRDGAWHAGTRLGADQRDAWLARTAQKPYPRTGLFATVSDLLSHVVCRIQPSVRAAYRDHEDPGGASLIARSHKRNGVETHPSAALVRSRAAGLAPVSEPREGVRAPWWPGERVQMMDGHGLAASDRRLKPLREGQGGALPGQSWVG